MKNQELEILLDKVLDVISGSVAIEQTERVIDLFAIAQQRNSIGFKVDELTALQPKKVILEF